MLPFPGVAWRGHIHPDVAILNLHRKAAHIIGPQVERATTRQVEAGMMPVAGQDAIVDSAFVQGETHMWTAVINSVNLAIVLEKRHHIMLDQHCQAALGLQFGQGCYTYPLAVRQGLGLLLTCQRHTTSPLW